MASKICSCLGIGILGMLSYDYYQVGIDGNYIFELSKWRRFDYLITRSINKYNDPTRSLYFMVKKWKCVKQLDFPSFINDIPSTIWLSIAEYVDQTFFLEKHIQTGILPKDYLKNETILCYINNHTYDIYLKKAIAKIYTPTDIDKISLDNLVYQPDNKIKEYLENNKIDWQKDLIHIPNKFWDKNKIHNELIEIVLPNNTIKSNSVSEILIKNNVIPSANILNNMVMSNDEFNKYVKYFNIKFVKYLSNGKIHNGIQYEREGKYEDYIELVPYAEKGGISFVVEGQNIGYNINHIPRNRFKYEYISDISVDDEGWTVIQGDRFKSTCLNLLNIRKIE